LGQSLRQYTKENGEPNFDLEKFAINSILSATNSSEMDAKDQNDIINKVKSSSTEHSDNGDSTDNYEKSNTNDTDNTSDDENLGMKEGVKNTVFQNPYLGVKKNGMEENKYLNFESTNKNGIFVNKVNIKTMIKEMLEEEPVVIPLTKPKEPKRITRRNKPFHPERLKETPDPNPKATNKDTIEFINHGSMSNINNEIEITFDVNGIRFVANFINTGEILEKPIDYNEPWVYQYETKPLSNNKKYKLGVSFYGHPKTNLTFSDFDGKEIPEIKEIK